MQGRFRVVAPGSARREEAELLTELYRGQGLGALDAVDGAYAFVVINHEARRAHVDVDKLGQS